MEVTGEHECGCCPTVPEQVVSWLANQKEEQAFSHKRDIISKLYFR